VKEEKPKPRRLSDIVRSLDTTQNLSIAALVDSLGERAMGALMFIFAVPNIIPAPPGTSSVLGLPLVILTFQLMIGRQSLWLPEAIRRRSIDAGLVSRFVARALPVLSRFEKILKPRLGPLVISNAAERVIGFVAFGLAVILFLPIPLMNIPAAIAIALLSLGLAERDGLFVLLGYAAGVACLVFLMLISSAIYAAALTFITVLFGG
jgi:hypothetical protein